jgi:hypothetical protein
MSGQPSNRDKRAATDRAARDPASAEHSQEELWAACIAEQPGIIDDIVKLISDARVKLTESPPLSPDTPPPGGKPGDA